MIHFYVVIMSVSLVLSEADDSFLGVGGIFVAFKGNPFLFQVVKNSFLDLVFVEGDEHWHPLSSR